VVIEACKNKPFLKEAFNRRERMYIELVVFFSRLFRFTQQIIKLMRLISESNEQLILQQSSIIICCLSLTCLIFM